MLNPKGNPAAITVFFSGNIVSPCAKGNGHIPTGREDWHHFQPGPFPAQDAVLDE